MSTAHVSGPADKNPPVPKELGKKALEKLPPELKASALALEGLDKCMEALDRAKDYAYSAQVTIKHLQSLVEDLV